MRFKFKLSILSCAIIISIVLAVIIFYVVSLIRIHQNTPTPTITNPASTETIIATPTTIEATLNQAKDHTNKINPPISNKAIERIVIVRKKDSLSKIFTRLQLKPEDAKNILKLKTANTLHNLRSGQKLTFYFINNKLEKFTLPINITDTLVVDKSYGRFRARINHVTPVERIQSTSLIINNSIYATAKKNNISQALIAKFIAAFKSKINIGKMLRTGDKIVLVYKDYYINNNKINKTSDLVAAGYVHGKDIRKIIKFTDKSGNSTFYTADGYSLTSPFIRYPLNFKRVSSPFSLHRINPVSGVYREHTGVDFAANMGTPIRATSSGVVTFAGRNGGYGNVAIIKHNQYTTLYGHMLKFASGIRVGGIVKQGQVIGYVGMTGRATGAHLHYEFRINNIPHDPLKIKLPDGEMIAKAYRSQFLKQAKPLLAQLNSFLHVSPLPNESKYRLPPKNQKKVLPKTNSKKIPHPKMNAKLKVTKSQKLPHTVPKKTKNKSTKLIKNKPPVRNKGKLR